MNYQKLLFIYLFMAGFFLAGNAAAQTKTVPLVKLSHLKKYLSSSADTTYILNFWATWCQPCVKELPAFEALQQQQAGKPVKVVLVSMDFAKDLEKRVAPFVAKNKLKSTVFLLDEPDQNAWIDLVDPTWTGAIPATLIVNNARKQRLFLEKPLTLAQLQGYLISHFH